MKHTYSVIVPLIGGTTIAMKEVFGKNPEYILSYSAFKDNDAHILNYLGDVKYHVIDEKMPKAVYTDVVGTVCPCAGLSMLNVKSSPDSEKNEWMYKTAEHVLGKIKPKVFFGENAPGFITKKGTPVRERMRDIGKKFRYSFSVIKTDTQLHGVPQRRVRSFYFFWKQKKAPILSWINEEAEPLSVFLEEKRSDKSAYNDKFAILTPLKEDHSWQFMKHKYKNLSYQEIVSKISESRTVMSYMLDNNLLGEFKKWLKKNYPDSTYIRYTDHVIDKTDRGMGFWNNGPLSYGDNTCAVTAKSFYTMHPTEERYLSVREMMTLMGLPSDFELVPRHTESLPINHICQNVPVNTAKGWVGEIKKFLEGRLESSEHSYLLQDNIAQRMWTE